MDIRASYDAAAGAYADHLADELARKPLDRHLLDRFAEATAGRGLVADLGCGPGQVARYLRDRGVATIGLDLSPAMVAIAARLHPEIDFLAGDMTRTGLADASLVGVAAFYAIVHLDDAGLAATLAEIRRILAPDGLALLAFHQGDEVVRVDDLFGTPVALDFRFFDADRVVEALRVAGLDVIERAERAPYPGVEYPSRRAYLLARAAIAE